ncbi:cupin domain-containing protein [Mesorhizobium australicum]|uniref:cupin domain-containing protein n=1 Tax=Mesorhizobium australicum TaxID=536018 RepID=UPI00333B1441
MELEALPHPSGKRHRGPARRRVAYQSPSDATSIGVSEWNPGEWPYATTEPEFCQILSGCATFMPDGGEPMPLKAGGAILMHPGTVGCWIVVEALRRLSLTLPRIS